MIVISGIIGKDVRASDVRVQLSAVGRGPAEFSVNSPGGVVFEALEIRDLIARHSGATTGRIAGVAASAASDIATAFEWLVVTSDSVYMLHNPAMMTGGDARQHDKSAAVLGAMSDRMAARYARRSGKTISEIREMMDAETYLFGEEIVAEGFADEIEAVDTPVSRSVAVARARLSFATAMHDNPITGSMLARVAARMTGDFEESKRIAELREWIERDPHNPQLREVVEAAIADGRTSWQANPWLLKAARDGALSRDDREAMKLMRMDEAEYRKYAR
jgi:ATP-dependent protease ClpP protease subunit